MLNKKVSLFIIAANVLLFGAVVFFIGNTFVQADTAVQTTPHVISYQGLLADSSGNLINGSRNLTITVYAAGTGGTSLWQEVHANVDFDAGAFNIMLGSATAMPDDLFDTPDRWLEMTVNGTTLSPRQQFASVPYALNADKIDGLDAADLGGLPSGAVVWFEDGTTPTGFTHMDNTISQDVGIWESSPDMPAGVEDVNCDVWTGAKIFCWNDRYYDVTIPTGALYNVNTNDWDIMSSTNAPSPRGGRSAIWTGSEMIVWGGDGASGYLNNGGRYNPIDDNWTTISTANAPSGREYSNVVWTGSEMIIWGGRGNGGDLYDGGRYNPASNSWIDISPTNIFSGTTGPESFWTGDKMLVWGGAIYNWPSSTVYTTTGSLYDPVADTWTVINGDGPPPLFTGYGKYVSAWTGTELIVMRSVRWMDGSIEMYFYNPVTDLWQHKTYILTGQEYASNDTQISQVSYPLFVAGSRIFTGFGIYDLTIEQFITTNGLPSGTQWANGNQLFAPLNGSIGYHDIRLLSAYTKD